jgi:hypothetical protein
MIPRIPADPAARSRRKEDLLLASGLLRVQAVQQLHDLGGRADLWGRRWLWLKGRLADPAVLAAAGAGAGLLAASGRLRSALRWAWRVWRICRPN